MLFHDQLVGKSLAHFKIGRVLGRGGMGVVYRGSDTELKRPVAIKVLAPEIAADESALKRFFQEAKTLAKLNHSNLVQIYSFSQADGLFYIAMEYVRGQSLDTLIAKERRLSVQRSLEIVTDVAKGLSVAHDLGIVHRDIKPQNILVGENGEVKVSDFGLAKLSSATTHLTRTGAMLGSPRYMSPEQWRGDDVTAQSDIYSLGVTLYEMLTGEQPYEAGAPYGYMHHALSTPFPSPSNLNSGVSTALDNVVHSMCAKDVRQRHRNCSDLIRDISQIDDEPSITSSNSERSESQLSIPGSLETNVAYSTDTIEEISGRRHGSNDKEFHEKQTPARGKKRVLILTAFVVSIVAISTAVSLVQFLRNDETAIGGPTASVQTPHSAPISATNYLDLDRRVIMRALEIGINQIAQEINLAMDDEATIDPDPAVYATVGMEGNDRVVRFYGEAVATYADLLPLLRRLRSNLASEKTLAFEYVVLRETQYIRVRVNVNR